jgi:hypothetical protein
MQNDCTEAGALIDSIFHNQEISHQYNHYFALISTEARVVSQSRFMVQPLPVFS